YISLILHPPKPTPFPYTTLFRSRDLVWSRRERLDDEERVAAGLAEELVRVEAVRVGELRNRSRRERAELPPRYALARRELADDRSEEHTSELQSLAYLVCRLLLE